MVSCAQRWVVRGVDSLTSTTKAQFTRTLAVKAQGSLNLYRAVAATLQPDFLCYFSSIQGFSFLSSRDSLSTPRALLPPTPLCVPSVLAPFPVGIINWGHWDETATNRYFGLIPDQGGTQFYSAWPSLRKSTVYKGSAPTFLTPW